MSIINPYCDVVADMTPTEFEKYCLMILEGYADQENLKDFKIVHNHKIQTHDGEYQIDVYAEFTALNVNFKVLAECKKYKKAIERKVVAELKQKLDSIGAHKGIILSTSGFQQGAAVFAKEHGIALIQILSRSILFAQMNSKPINSSRLLNQYFSNPKFLGVLCDDYGFPLTKIHINNNLIRGAEKCPNKPHP